MKTKILYILVTVVFIGAQTTCSPEKQKPAKVSIVPWPQNLQIETETTYVGKTLFLVNATSNPEIDLIINTCVNDLKEIGFQVTTSSKGHTGKRHTLQINLSLEKGDGQKYGDEEYRLIVDKHISIYAVTASGLFWGTRTLLQLLQEGPGILIRALNISDHPVSGYRGLMMDAARHFHTMDFHLQTIKKISSYKLNHYMIHFSDNESYTLPSDRYPQLPTPGRNYTKDEIRRLVDVAKEYNVTIVPSVDVPGHAGALIQNIPELGFDDQKRRINIAREETYQILQNLFEELMELFPVPYWHLGADEVGYPDLKDSPDKAYSAWMQKENMTSGGQLLIYFINRMYDFVKSKGYTMLVWEGFKPHLKPEVNREIIVCPFNNKYENVMPQDYMNAGYTILNTSWSPLYVADKKSVTTPETLAMWTIYMFGAGRSPQPFRYWKKFSPDELTTDIIGAQMCSWANEEKAEWGLLFGSDAGPGFPEYGRPGARVQIFSERVWTGDKTTVKDLLERTGTSYWD